MAQWIRIHLSMQGTRFDPGSRKSPHAAEQLRVCRSCGAGAPERGSCGC